MLIINKIKFREKLDNERLNLYIIIKLNSS